MKIGQNSWKKLIDYFNIYNYERGILFQFSYEDSLDEVHLISKREGFVKRLIDTKKIDLNKVKSKSFKVFAFRFQEYASYENELLMLLAIQDNPIEFLVSILK